MTKITDLTRYADSPQARASDARLEAPKTLPALTEEEDDAGWAEFTRVTRETRERDEQRSRETVRNALNKLEACIGTQHLDTNEG
ncbi:hypothetical protein H8F21_13765 [Pseudomonas sp. P66]|uniref:Uncharacterized protein n=1 Tax=Pseudomonas arcuscaelestis TaxID=2710591 RepID=A0ABS2BYE3_9PSED|nr:hypothetical protein [Pseudomonas arcuscaelestis]MBM5458632.1 hypothetical protein [Pseudomonas arcuscaelestis]